MRKLTAVIITFNEARNIKRCVASLQGVADEIVVVDSFSTDATPSICKGLGVQFHQRRWKRTFACHTEHGFGGSANEDVMVVRGLGYLAC